MKMPYQILAEGYFSEEQVTVDWTSEAMRRNAETSRLIEETWSEQVARAQENGQLLFPGEMCRLAHWNEEANVLNLTFGLTDYKESVGTNLCHPEIAEMYGEEYLSNGTAVCSVVVTADHRLIVQQRNDQVFEYPSRYHVCGGNLEPSQPGSGQCPNPFSQVKRELFEELAIAADQIGDIHCLGLVRDSQTLKPEVVFETVVRVPAAQIQQRTGPEHKRLLVLEDSPSKLMQFLGIDIDLFVPVGLACLAIYGKRRFGEHWYEGFIAQATGQ